MFSIVDAGPMRIPPLIPIPKARSMETCEEPTPDAMVGTAPVAGDQDCTCDSDPETLDVAVKPVQHTTAAMAVSEWARLTSDVATLRAQARELQVQIQRIDEELHRASEKVRIHCAPAMYESYYQTDHGLVCYNPTANIKLTVVPVKDARGI